MRVLVTGATGYVGGRLVERLLEAGHTVRVLARDPESARARRWSERVEIARGDLLDPESLEAALSGMEVAFYLVHSMHGGSDFAARDRCVGITNLASPAERSGLIIEAGNVTRSPRRSLAAS